MSGIPGETRALLPVSELLAKHPSPLHIYYEKLVEEDANALKKGLFSAISGCELFYSSKTNSLLPLLRTMLRLGWGIEVVGSRDRERALAAGAEGSRILLNGASWKKGELASAIYHDGVTNLTLDSEPMAELLGSLLREQPRPLHIALRIHDGASHFGFHPQREQLERALKHIPRECIASLGLHIHCNQPGSPRSVEEIAEDFRLRAQRLMRAGDVLAGSAWNPTFANLGGGIDSPHVYRPHPHEFADFHHPQKATAFRAVHSEPRFTLEQAGRAVSEAVAHELKHSSLSKRVLFEPGRAACTRALSTLISVTSVKRHFYPDAEVLITDGNTALLGPLHRGIHPLAPAKTSRPLAINTFVYGNLPHSGDWLFQGVRLPPMHEGDKLLIGHTGAYFLALQAEFGHALPAVYSADRNELVF